MSSLRDSLDELSRTVRRHRGLLSAGLTAAAVAVALPVVAPPPAPTSTLVTATRDLEPGAVLAEADLVTAAWPRSVVPDGAVSSVGDLLGRALAGPVRRGEALTDVRLAGSGLLPRSRGLVATPVRLADPASAGLLAAGDRVDVLAVRTDAPQAAAVTVAAGVEVLAVPAPGESDPEGALVVLASTPAAAARLAAAAVGSRLSVTVLSR